MIGITWLIMGGLALAGANHKPLTMSEMNRSRLLFVDAALREYKDECGEYPRTEQGLQALLEDIHCGNVSRGPITSAIPKDKWGHYIDYFSDGITCTITSFGKDGVPGGEGDEADMVRVLK